MKAKLLSKTDTEHIEEIGTNSKGKENFDFVDTIRCISMMGIVFEHCPGIESGTYSSMFNTVVEASVYQSFKFSTIAFFLIGGFLINYKFQEYTAKEYLKNRFRSTIKPWLFWLLVFVALMILEKYTAYLKGDDNTIATDFFGYARSQLVFGLFYTSSWFVLNFLICICILLIFKKYLYNWWFGGILGIISLVYSVNLYQNWFATKHTFALFGFVFYLWLGVILNKNFDKVMNYIKCISWRTILWTVTGLFILAVIESFILLNLRSKDAYNTLRISNILYSFGVFAILLKIGNIKILQRKLEPRQTTFGIYLVHYILVFIFLPLIFEPMGLKYLNYSIWVNSGIHIIRFLIVYSLSFSLVKLIRLTRFKWIVGG